MGGRIKEIQNMKYVEDMERFLINLGFGENEAKSSIKNVAKKYISAVNTFKFKLADCNLTENEIEATLRKIPFLIRK